MRADRLVAALLVLQTRGRVTATIEVVEPESVRAELGRIGSELAQRCTP
ncbi:hypothetical protein JQS43_15170 [Natronosporangium hydrolyticum]|uniref:Uncharacterized protein n=1 Tax=Natronosporangium hydrolyticum TaxID=2811111 RepID=A0A895Y9K3_9ACTN|nr:hypothetical protein [Natronosporangium hydrolyticum]QSB12995.1 hypothetical protein JQS43_15170 [Natronosporangium hydrolyticum]